MPVQPRAPHAPLEPWEEILRARFSPTEIDYSRCLAREFNSKRGRQCGGVVVSDGLCKKHVKTAPPHGMVHCAIPPAKWKAFGIKDSEVAALKRGASGGMPVAPVASTEPAVSSASSQVLAPALQPRDDSIVSLAPGSLLKRRRPTRPAQEDSTTSGVSVVDGCIVRPSRVRDDTAMPQRGRIVSGFGNERSEDVVADRARLDAEMLARQSHRNKEGERGRLTDKTGKDVGRSAGS